MPRDVDNDYYYDAGTLNEQLNDFNIYEKDGELHFHDARTNDVTKVKASGVLEIPATDMSKINNTHVVQSEEDLYSLFPDVTDGSWSDESDLEDGDKVEFDGRNAPYRPDRDLRIESVSDVVIEGSAPIDVKPEDGANAGKFVLTGNDGNPDTITFRNVGFDGNADNMTGGTTPFILNWVCDNLTAEGCFATNNYPYHVHNGGGSSIIFKNGADFGRVINCTFDDVGDRSVEFHQNIGAMAMGNHADNGFDRMITFDGCDNCGAIGNTSTGNQEGSFMGVNGSSAPASNIVFMNNHIIGKFRNLISLEPNNHPVTFCTAIGNTAENVDNLTGIDAPRNLIHEDTGTGLSNSGGHVYLGNFASGLNEAGFELRHGNRNSQGANERPGALVDYNILLEPATYGFDIKSSAEDVRIGKFNQTINPGTDVWTNSGARTRIFGIAHGSGNAEIPGASFFEPGDFVDWLDTGDGSGNGLYMLARDGSNWYKVSDTTIQN